MRPSHNERQRQRCASSSARRVMHAQCRACEDSRRAARRLSATRVALQGRALNMTMICSVAPAADPETIRRQRRAIQPTHSCALVKADTCHASSSAAATDVCAKANVPPRSSRARRRCHRRRRRRVYQQQAHTTRWRASWRASSAASVSAITSSAERRTIVGPSRANANSTPQARALATLVAMLSWLTASMRPAASSAHSSPTARRRCRPRRAPSRQTNDTTHGTNRLPSLRRTRRTRPGSSASSATRSRVRRGTLARSSAGINTSKLSKSKNAHCTQPHYRTSYFYNYAFRSQIVSCSTSSLSLSLS